MRRALYLGFLAAVAFFLYAAEVVLAHPRPPISTTTYFILLAVSAWAVLGMKPLLTKLARKAAVYPAQRARLLHTGYVIRWCMSASVVLWGVCVRFLGGTRLEASPFYIVGCLLLLAARPAEPLTEQSPSAPSE